VISTGKENHTSTLSINPVCLRSYNLKATAKSLFPISGKISILWVTEKL